MKYYSTQRPVSIGTFPESQKVIEIHNFDRREYVTNIHHEAWGWIEYENPLTEKEAKDYELVLEYSETDRLRTMLMNAVDLIFEHESGDASRYEDVNEFWEYLFDQHGSDSKEMAALGLDLSDYGVEV